MKRVLITGGNGGIARAIREKLEALGDYEVRTPDIDKLDVTDVNGVEEYVSNWVPDILVNNAGKITVTSIGACDINQILVEKQVLDINLFGLFNCTAAVLRHNPEAHIVNVGSAAATAIHATWSSYCASKAGVVMATQCWADDGKSCVCVSPGRTATPMRSYLYPDEDVNTLMKPEDFAQIIVYAIQKKYPNGENIKVNIHNVQELIEAGADKQ